MFTFPCAILSNADPSITWKVFFINNIFLVTLGNYFGGWIVAVSYYALYGIPIEKELDFSLNSNSYMQTFSSEVVVNPIILEESIRPKYTVKT